MDAMQLQKLLYYVQAWHLAITDEPLFSDQIKAWADGPVVPAVWHARKDRATRRAAAQDVDGISLDEMTSNLIDLVMTAYGSMSGEELSALTHVERPWLEARGDLPEGAEGRTPISTEAIAKYYRTNRKLGSRTAADLASGGVYVRNWQKADPVDVDAILSSLSEDCDDPGVDPWGGASLDLGEKYDAEGIDHQSRRVYADS